jgi:hypothetical protein
MSTDVEPVVAVAPRVYGPDPIVLDGRPGRRYWVHHPFPYTENPRVNERLSGYPLAVFQPPGRPPEETPLLVGLQGMAAPYQWNGFLVPALLDMGIGCVLFDTPCAGERSLLRRYDGEVLDELLAFKEHGVALTARLVLRLFEVVARDFRTVLGLVAERHGLTDTRLALFGVSLGTLLAAFAFLRDKIGTRLLGTIGHADLPRFARSYAPWFRPLLAWLPGRLLDRLTSHVAGPRVSVGLCFCRVLHELTGGLAREIDPMSYLDRANERRRVCFLVGQDDPLVRPADAVACARRFADGACYVVPGLGHGGDRFVEHARYFVTTQLGDWRG